jgi:ribose transport system permease protein
MPETPTTEVLQPAIQESESASAVPTRGWRRWLTGDRQTVRRVLQGQGLLLMLLVLVVIFSVTSPYFFNTQNFFTISGGVSVLGIMAIAQTFLIISGGVDVSVGSTVALSGVIVGLGELHGMNIWIAALLAVLAGAGIGAINGVIVVQMKINPLITTLGTLSIFSGLAFLISSGQTLIVSNSQFTYLGAGYVGSVPFSFVIFLVLFAMCLFVERFTPLGRTIYAIGGNIEASRLAGLRVKMLPFLMYVASGLSAGIAGVIICSQLNASSPEVGATYLLSVVTAVILGGASLAGGRGSLVGTLIAIFILGVLQNGFALLQFSSYAQTVALGVALIIAVLLDQTVRALEK